MKKKLEADINELEIALDHANKVSSLKIVPKIIQSKKIAILKTLRK